MLFHDQYNKNLINSAKNYLQKSYRMIRKIFRIQSLSKKPENQHTSVQSRSPGHKQIFGGSFELGAKSPFHSSPLNSPWPLIFIAATVN